MTDNRSAPPESSSRRRQPKQTRGVETRNSILEAASDLFAEQGYEKTTTHQIAGHADVSVGALYRYFADKEAILKEVYQHEMSVLRDRILEEFGKISIVDFDVREAIREGLARAFKVFEERPALRQVLGEQSRKIPELAEFRLNQEKELHGTVRRILTAVPQVDVPDAETGAYVITIFCESIIEDFIVYRKSQGLYDMDRVLDTAADVLTRFIHIKESE
jgi:AcrR family transcriptional regulator